ncbi:hypothetical protein [Sulfurimonas sp.]|jgi:hypothetical protein|uniref:hypothetical protein n=1 Tax=Sulfurimonas sp. TaxID=2022749 RepID=UPI002A363986|nr:hypothetical protein [Sulfurimonas sp.]MDY0123623.1 hypothetical protein [Sulfurimonas sp.]
MKKFNLFKEIITVDKNSLQVAIDAQKTFGIDIGGKICHEPFTTDDILIYIGIPDAKAALCEALGRKYQVVEDGSRVLIKAFSNWQEIIGFNTPRATYDDTTGDGVDEFSTKEMEDIGWHAAEFNINYRTLVELLEEKCEGTLICIEQEDPYQFSGLGFIADHKHAAETLFAYCQKEVKRLIEEDEDFEKESLNDDELEAAEFFKAL